MATYCQHGSRGSTHTRSGDGLASAWTGLKGDLRFASLATQKHQTLWIYPSAENFIRMLVWSLMSDLGTQKVFLKCHCLFKYFFPGYICGWLRSLAYLGIMNLTSSHSTNWHYFRTIDTLFESYRRTLHVMFSTVINSWLKWPPVATWLIPSFLWVADSLEHNLGSY